MKKFLMNNWKKIIYVIAGFAIILNLINVSTTPTTIVDDFYRYGPNYSKDILDNAKDINVDADGHINETSIMMSNDTGIETNYTRGIIIFTLLIVGILILQNIMDSKAAPAKKK